MGHGNADLGLTTPSSTFYEQGRFGRMFPTLGSLFAADTPSVRAALIDIGKPGGIMDAGDDLTDPLALLANAALSADNPDNPTMTAGFTFLGQFIDHDITFDLIEFGQAPGPGGVIRNFRIPALDLDNVYGGGPGVSPALYDQSVDEEQRHDARRGDPRVCGGDDRRATALRPAAQQPERGPHR